MNSKSIISAFKSGYGYLKGYLWQTLVNKEKMKVLIKAHRILVIILLANFLSNCSFLSKVSTLEPNKSDPYLTQVDKYHHEFGKWNSFTSNTYTCYADSSFECAIGTKLPYPNVSWGPLFVPIIPNFYYVWYRVFRSTDHNFFVNFVFWGKNRTYDINLSRLHFYQLNNTEIGIDTIKFIHRQQWSLLESEISSTIFLGLKIPDNRMIKDSIISINSINYLRFNLKINSYKLKEGLIIRFEKGFMINDSIDLPEIRLYRKNKYYYNPFIFAS